MESRTIEPTAPTFTLLETNESRVPWRSRSVLPDYRRFVGRGGAVLIKPELLGDLRRRAHQALPAETGGLVAGRVFRDEHGPYSVVFGFKEAPPGAGGPGRFRMDADETYQLKQRLSAAEPTCDVIGWWHTHSHPMPYSSTDLANQALWTDPQHVGLLVFAQGDEFGLVYQGPAATPLPFDLQQRLSRAEPTPRPVRRDPDEVPPLSAQLAPHPVRQHVRRAPRRVNLVVFPVVLLALLLLVVMLQIVELTRGTAAPVRTTPLKSRVTHSHPSQDRVQTSVPTAGQPSTQMTSPAKPFHPVGGHLQVRAS